MDRLAQFIEERCVVGEAFTAQASSLFSAYQHWCEDSGERALSAHAFVRKLTEKGFEKRHLERGARYQRIGLKAEESFSAG
jgi:putative DNA primase/helicase